MGIQVPILPLSPAHVNARGPNKAICPELFHFRNEALQGGEREGSREIDDFVSLALPGTVLDDTPGDIKAEVIIAGGRRVGLHFDAFPGIELLQIGRIERTVFREDALRCRGLGL
jgi:hypothetical protein